MGASMSTQPNSATIFLLPAAILGGHQYEPSHWCFNNVKSVS